MTVRRELFKAARGVAVSLVRYFDAVLWPPAPPEPEISEEVETEIRRKLERDSRRNGTRRWNQSRPGALTIPAWLERHEAIHGTKSTLELLHRIGKNNR